MCLSGYTSGLVSVVSVHTTESEEKSTPDERPMPGYQRVRSSVVIDAPAETVWEVVTDPGNYAEAIDWVHEVRREDDGPMGEGSVYVERAKPGLREGTYRWEVTEFDPPRRAVHVHEGGEIEAHLAIEVAPIDDDTTHYAQVMDFRALPAFRPLGYVLERTVMRRGMQRDFDGMILPNYKAMAEARSGGE